MDFQLLDRYITEVVARRPREWNCGNLVEGWLKLHAPAVATALEPNIPRPADLKQAWWRFAGDGILDAHTYRDKGIEWSEGMLTATDTPAPGDLAFANALCPDLSALPSAGIVVSKDEAVFLGWRGGLTRASLDPTQMAFASVPRSC